MTLMQRGLDGKDPGFAHCSDTIHSRLASLCISLASRPLAGMQGQDLRLADRALSASAADLVSAVHSNTGAVLALVVNLTTTVLSQLVVWLTGPAVPWDSRHVRSSM